MHELEQRRNVILCNFDIFFFIFISDKVLVI